MSYTITVTGNRAWLTDPLDPGGASVAAVTRRQGTLADTRDGELRVFVGNRQELVAYDSETDTIPITFSNLTQAQLAQVQRWKGATLLLRTTDGQRYYGGFLTVNQTTYLLATPPVYDAEVSFLCVSYSDTV